MPSGRDSVRRHVLRKGSLLSAPGLLLLACSASEEPARGQLMIALQSDMAVPGDFNRIRLQVLVRGDLRHDGTYTVAPDGTTKLPATLAVVAGSEKNPPVEVRVIGIRGTDAQTFSKVITTVPSSRIATLHVPMQWMCKGEVVQQGVGDDAVYESSCAPSSDQTERSCVVGRCTSVVVKEADLPDFDPEKVFGGGRRPGDPSGQCFDVQACFRSGMDVTAELDNDCRLDLDVPDGYEASFAIRVPQGEGICDAGDDSAPCFVPLDKDERYGWREIDRGARAQIPEAICDRLAGEPELALFATFACDEKTNELPTCGEWSSSPTAGVANPPDPIGGSGGEGGDTSGGTGGTSSGGAVNAGTGGTGQGGGTSGGGSPGAGGMSQGSGGGSNAGAATGGGSGPIGDGGANGDAGGGPDTGGRGGGSGGCEANPPEQICESFEAPAWGDPPGEVSGLIVDFYNYSPSDGSFGVTASGELTGGTALFQGPTSPPLNLEVSYGSLRVTGTVSSFETSGIQFWFGPCTDASAFSGLLFAAGGDLGGGRFAVDLLTHATTPVDEVNMRGGCVFSDCATRFDECMPHSTLLSFPVEPYTHTVPFGYFTGGMPVTTLDPSGVLGVQFRVECGSDLDCPVDFTLGNLYFMSFGQ